MVGPHPFDATAGTGQVMARNSDLLPFGDWCRFGQRPFVVRMNGMSKQKEVAHGHRSEPQSRC